MGLRFGFAAAGLVALITGCFQPPYEVSFSVAVTNTGETVIRGASVAFDQYVSLDGAVAPGKSFIEIDVRHPVPETAKVSWYVDESAKIERELPVKAIVGADFKGRLDFQINGEVVQLVVSCP